MSAGKSTPSVSTTESHARIKGKLKSKPPQYPPVSYSKEILIVHVFSVSSLLSLSIQMEKWTLEIFRRPDLSLFLGHMHLGSLCNLSES